MGNIVSVYDEKKELNKTPDLRYEIRSYYRYVRKNIRIFFKNRQNNSLKKIVYITTDIPPKEYILEFQKQYPDKEFLVLLPTQSDVRGYEKVFAPVEYFVQNKCVEAQLYKYPLESDNIQIYGIYSDVFSFAKKEEINDIKYIGAFVKCAQIFARKLDADIVHADRIPFFLGSEFHNENITKRKTKNLFKQRIKVFQVADDFESYNFEPFWSLLNIADNSSIKRLCKDKLIRKYFAQLFKISQNSISSKMNECLDTFYFNYVHFRTDVGWGEEVNENSVLKKLNARVIKLFPKMKSNLLYYNPMINSAQKADKWVVLSKTYYDNICNGYGGLESLKEQLTKRQESGLYMDTAIDVPKESKVIYKYDVTNFKDWKPRNKRYLIKEFSAKRIDAKFIDSSFFKERNPLVEGYLDPYYEFPLILYVANSNEKDENIICVINSILKLFELNKNFQIIINIPNGLNNHYIKSFVEFCKEHSEIDGRWVYINSELNLSQFYASSDILLSPKRNNADYENVLFALKYGCLPVVTKYGIYNDIIVDIYDDLNLGCGFKSEVEGDYNENYLKTLIKVLNVYKEASWNAVIRNAMKVDTGWNFEKIEKYNSVYEELIQ